MTHHTPADSLRSAAPPTTQHRTHLRVANEPPQIDLVAAEQAVHALLAALGQDPESEQLRETPRRVSSAYAELLTPLAFDLTTFRE